MLFAFRRPKNRPHNCCRCACIFLTLNQCNCTWKLLFERHFWVFLAFFFFRSVKESQFGFIIAWDLFFSLVLRFKKRMPYRNGREMKWKTNENGIKAEWLRCLSIRQRIFNCGKWIFFVESFRVCSSREKRMESMIISDGQLSHQYSEIFERVNWWDFCVFDIYVWYRVSMIRFRPWWLSIDFWNAMSDVFDHLWEVWLLCQQ